MHTQKIKDAYEKEMQGYQAIVPQRCTSCNHDDDVCDHYKMARDVWLLLGSASLLRLQWATIFLLGRAEGVWLSLLELMAAN
jgi:hypothetical protein